LVLDFELEMNIQNCWLP